MGAHVNLPRIAAGLAFNILGLLVAYKGIKVCRLKGIGEGFLDMIIGIGFALIGLLIWTGYIS